MIINLSDFRPQVAQLTEDMENLLDAAEKLFSGGLLKDDNNDLDISIKYGAWEKYRKILYGFMAAEEDGCNLLCIRYAEAPSIINNFPELQSLSIRPALLRRTKRRPLQWLTFSPIKPLQKWMGRTKKSLLLYQIFGNWRGSIMHIKENPVLKGHEFAGFVLDTSAIELHSSDKRNIRLPYSGPLPDALQKNDGAFFSICINVGLTICVSLIVMDGNKERRFSVEATAQEKNDLLFSFFFVNKGGSAFHTRWDCGLTQYWLGHYQDAYIHWRRFVYEEYGMDGLIRQLSRKALKQVVLYIGEYGEIA